MAANSAKLQGRNILTVCPTQTKDQIQGFKFRAMRLTFKLRFHTAPGDSMCLVGDHEIFGSADVTKAIPLNYVDHDHWQVTLVLPPSAVPNEDITYHYIWLHATGSFAEDWGAGRTVNPAACGREELLIVDSWNHPGFFENAFYAEPFRDVLFDHSRELIPEPVEVSGTNYRFRVKAPLLARHETVCLLGSCAAMGNWDTSRPILLGRRRGKDYFSAHLDLNGQLLPIEYKYGVYDQTQETFIRFEEGTNRFLTDGPSPEKDIVLNDGFIRLPANTWRGAGVSIPVFSLRSEAGFGVGEFLDLKRLVDWCGATGIKMIQLLPVNDTIATHTWADSYPYSAISAFALHPLYLHLPNVVQRENQKLLDSLEPERLRLNALPDLDYQAVMKAKLDVLRKIYSLQSRATFARKEYKEFIDANKEWLIPYAFFCYLRDLNRTPNFSDWPRFRRYEAKNLKQLAESDHSVSDEVGFHYFTQFHLHLQLKEVASYAHEHRVILKGDIPIGVYRYGTDAWQEPELYHMDLQAGAPPDAFAAKGQNWSFPTYNWPKMAGTGFAWWKARLRQMSNYFDAFRIDHILGFFRIWSIPIEAVEGILGYFDPAIPLSRNEFENRVLRFDAGRLLDPYITEEVLREGFGNGWQKVRDQFLTKTGAGKFVLRREFDTQRKVEKYFSHLEENDANLRLRIGLFDLISNVILLQHHQEEGFHLRFQMENTSSFRNLDPKTQAGLKELYLDYFLRRQDKFWEARGFERLPAIKQVTNMLICGEDLGMVPKCVPDVIKQLGILGLEVQRMPKSSNEDFSPPAKAGYLMVVTPSTHDMSTIRGWWEEDRTVTQKFFNSELGQIGEAPEKCEPWINRAIISQHLSSPAMWSVFQLQDLMGMDQRLRRKDADEERINVPANPRHYWRYRMHVTVEQLRAAEDFNKELKTLIVQSGR